MPEKPLATFAGSSVAEVTKDPSKIDVAEQKPGEMEKFVEQMKMRHGMPSSPAQKPEWQDGLSLHKKAWAKQLMFAVQAGEVPSQGPMAKTMRRHLTNEERAKHDKGSHEYRASFRLKWAQQQLSQLTQVAHKVEEWRKVDIGKGRYLSASRIFREEGGTQEDIIPTQTLVSKCWRMGHPWTKYNHITERVDFLYMERYFMEEYDRAWSIFEKLEEEKSEGPEAVAQIPDKKAQDKTIIEQNEVQLTPQPVSRQGSKRQAAEPAVDGQVPQRQKVTHDQHDPKVIIANAVRVKKSMAAITTSASNLHGGWPLSVASISSQNRR